MDTLQTAQFWREWGAAPFPVIHGDKRPEGAWRPYQHTLPSEAHLQAWFARGDHNLALITGWQGLTVIDFDEEPSYRQWQQWVSQSARASLVARLTYRVRTSKGWHFYVKLPEATKSRALLKPDPEEEGKFTRVGVDIRSAGGYVIAPPSLHPSGSNYQAANPGAPIVRVESLSDVLPLSMLVHNEPGSKTAVSTQAVDPWDTADPWARATVADRSTTERVRGAYRLEDFFEGAERTGSHHLVALCPFHDDDHPSFWIDTDKQICNCFSCGFRKPLDVINLYARTHGISNREAIAQMASKL